MFAIAATSFLAEAHAKRTVDGLQRHTSSSEKATQEWVPPNLTAKLCQSLEDSVERVRVPAAVTLHCMGKENEKVCSSSENDRLWQNVTIPLRLSLLSQAKQVLLSVLDSAYGPSEQWASVQCLALAGVSSPGVIASLLQHLLHQDAWGRERAADLLTRVSRKTVVTYIVSFPVMEWD